MSPRSVSLAALSLALSRLRRGCSGAKPMRRRSGESMPKGEFFLFGSFHLLPADVEMANPRRRSALNGARQS